MENVHAPGMFPKIDSHTPNPVDRAVRPDVVGGEDQKVGGVTVAVRLLSDDPPIFAGVTKKEIGILIPRFIRLVLLNPNMDDANLRALVPLPNVLTSAFDKFQFFE